MISKIISRAECLRELASNPKSFSNCPDLHGGVPRLSEDGICRKPALEKNRSDAGNSVIPSVAAVEGILEIA